MSLSIVPDLRIVLFGRPRVAFGDAPLLLAAPPRAILILAYLALHPKAPVSREHLAFTLWPDAGEAEARANLRRHLHQLNRALPPRAEGAWVTSETKTVRLDPHAAIWTDVGAFDRAAERSELRREAVDWYTGPLLEGWDEEWIEPFRERYAETQIAYLAALAAAAEARNAIAEALELARRILEVDPWREDAIRSIVRWRAQGGDRAGALGEYREFAARLKAEMGVEPMPESRALYDEIVAGTAGTAAPARREEAPCSQLPAPLTAFLGREAELVELAALIAAHRMLTLTGAGGVGKTRLALALANAAQARFPDGMWFVDLAAVTEPALVVRSVATALGVAADAPEMESALVRLVGARRGLVILDNCEHVIAGCAHLARVLLAYCPQLRIVATSRTRVGVEGEFTWRVPSLEVPAKTTVAVEAARRYPAIALVAGRARSVRANFSVEPRNVAAIAAICRRLDGIPLAIELAAARMNQLPAATLERRLAERFDLLGGATQNAIPRQHTLRALVDWSYELLTDFERRLFRRLSVFIGGWTLDAAESVCASEELASDEIVVHLTSLVEKSMVSVETDGLASRYRFLETFRAYAAEKLAAADETRALRARHLAYYVALAERAERADSETDDDADDRLDVLAHEIGNVRAALAFEEESVDAWPSLRLATSLTRFWLRIGDVSEGERWIARTLERAGGDAPDTLIAKAYYGNALLAMQVQDYATSPAHDRAAVDLAKQLDYRESVASRLVVATALVALGREGDEFISTVEETLRAGRGHEDEWLATQFAFYLGLCAHYRGNADAAHYHLRSALETAARSGARFLPAAIAAILARISADAGNSAVVHAALARGAPFIDPARTMRILISAYASLADAAAHDERFEDAVRAFGTAEALMERSGGRFAPRGSIAAQWLETARERLGETFALAYADGASRSLEDAVMALRRVEIGSAGLV